MNFRSEQYTVYRVRAPLTLCFPYVVFVLLAWSCIYCFLPPLFYCPVVRRPMLMPLCSTTSSTTVPLLSSYQASRATSPLPHTAYFSIFICCTRHMLLLRYNPIQLHSLSLSPLDYLSDILCCLYIYNIYSSGPCALLVIGYLAGRDHSGSDRGNDTI